jgi:hypothetical protein
MPENQTYRAYVDSQVVIARRLSILESRNRLVMMGAGFAVLVGVLGLVMGQGNQKEPKTVSANIFQLLAPDGTAAAVLAAEPNRRGLAIQDGAGRTRIILSFDDTAGSALIFNDKQGMGRLAVMTDGDMYEGGHFKLFGKDGEVKAELAEAGGEGALVLAGRGQSKTILNVWKNKSVLARFNEAGILAWSAPGERELQRPNPVTPSKAGWRELKLGMSPDSVRELLGEPVHIKASGTRITWEYEDGHVMFFDVGGGARLDGWSEPEN